MSNKHRGKILASVAERHPLSIVEIARRASYTQSTFYKHKLQEDLPFKILYKYAKVMDYYFANELPEFTKYLKDNRLNEPSTGEPTYEDLVKENRILKQELFDTKQDLLDVFKQLNDCRNNGDQMRKVIETYKDQNK